MRSIALYVFTMLKTKATAAREGFRRLCEHRLERRGEVDRERARANDTGNSRRPVEQVTLVLVTVRLELLRGPDRGVFVDVGLAVAEAELVHVASLTAAPKIYTKNETSASNQPSVSSLTTQSSSVSPSHPPRVEFERDATPAKPTTLTVYPYRFRVRRVEKR